MDDTVLSIQSIREIAYMCKFWHRQLRHTMQEWITGYRGCVYVREWMLDFQYVWKQGTWSKIGIADRQQMSQLDQILRNSKLS